jgi:hypothetical protein
VLLELPGDHNDVGLDRIGRPEFDMAGYRIIRDPRADEALTRTLSEIWPVD